MCVSCAQDFQQVQASRSLFPHLKEEPIAEQGRVMAITTDHLVLRLIRTETQTQPEDWVLLISRVGSVNWRVGTAVTITVTPSELEWLRGERELD
jgi:hypothetical protein